MDKNQIKDIAQRLLNEALKINSHVSFFGTISCGEAIQLCRWVLKPKQPISFGDVNPKLQEYREGYMSFLAHGYDGKDVTCRFGYSVQWGQNQSHEMRALYKCKTSVQLFCKLKDLGWQPIPEDKLLSLYTLSGPAKKKKSGRALRELLNV